MNTTEAKSINYAAPNQQKLGYILRPACEKYEARITALFRNYLREEFPETEDSDLIKWRWTDGPEYCFKDVPRDIPGHPGQAAIERVHLAIRQNKTREGPLASILPIRWRLTSQD
jgi:hypothetical protein